MAVCPEVAWLCILLIIAAHEKPWSIKGSVIDISTVWVWGAIPLDFSLLTHLLLILSYYFEFWGKWVSWCLTLTETTQNISGHGYISSSSGPSRSTYWAIQMSAYMHMYCMIDTKEDALGCTVSLTSNIMKINHGSKSLPDNSIIFSWKRWKIEHYTDTGKWGK